MKANLDRLFNAEAIAVIGASHDVNSISGQPIAHLKSHAYPGRIYPVNPRHANIAGSKSYASVSELPEIPDLALILVNASRVAAALRECGEKKIPFAIIFSSGFAEIGGDGRKLQQEVTAIAEQYGIGVVGPNCQGMMNIADHVYAGFGSPFKMEPFHAGPISMVSQSGGFGYSMASLAQDLGLGFTKIISIGNEAGVSSIDFMHYFVQDPATRIIVAYIEGLRDAYRLVEVGNAALRGNKPILIWKMGKTEAGQRAAASHTGNLGGDNVLYETAFKQTGMIQIDDLQQLVDYGNAFLYGKRPRGNRVAIVSASGGAGVVLADECGQNALELPALQEASISRLKALLPSFSSLLNPIDATPSLFNSATGNTTLREVFRIIVDDPNVDVLIISNSSVHGALATKIAQEIIDLDRTTEKPVFVSWGARDHLAAEAFQLLASAKIPFYKTPVRCAGAVAVVSRFAEYCRNWRAEQKIPAVVLENPSARSALKDRVGYVSEYESKRMLQGYGIHGTREELATSEAQAGAIAERIGYPVAIKVQSPDVAHKTEAKGVRLSIGSEQELYEAYAEVLENTRRYAPTAKIEGVLIQEMVKDAAEAILGIVNKPQFGPAIMFGLGGIFAEVMKDVSFRLAPVNRAMAISMIREIKGYPILMGARGCGIADVDALAEAIVNLSAMAVDLKEEIEELDINPLFVMNDNGGVKAGDALIRIRTSQSS